MLGHLYEHTAHLAYLIRRAKKQRSLTINAFGEVIINSLKLLQYHQIQSTFKITLGACVVTSAPQWLLKDIKHRF